MHIDNGAPRDRASGGSRGVGLTRKRLYSRGGPVATAVLLRGRREVDDDIFATLGMGPGPFATLRQIAVIYTRVVEDRGVWGVVGSRVRSKVEGNSSLV